MTIYPTLMKTLLSGFLLIFALSATGNEFISEELRLTNQLVTATNSEPEVVSTLSDRDAIPTGMRQENMYCYVADNHIVYQLQGGIANTHWVALGISSSFQIQGPAGSLPYIDQNGLLATDMRYRGKSKYDYSGANDLGSGNYVNVNGLGNKVNDKSHNLINGYNSYSDGSYVLTVGERDTVHGMNSTALGNDITLKEKNQFAAGVGLVAQSIGEALLGQYNTLYSGNGSQWNGQDRLVTVGNGTSATNRSDALIIYKDGKAEFFGDLTAPNIYTKNQVDSAVAVIGNGNTGTLNLSGSTLTLSNSNSVNFSGWDTDASDDFSGDYNNLINKPTLFSGDFSDLNNAPSLYTRTQTDSAIAANQSVAVSQTLNLAGNELAISGANTVTFSGWDMNAADDFSGNYNDLTDAPAIYTQAQVDSIRQGVVDSMTAYVDSAVISQAHSLLASNRALSANDCGKTIYVKNSTVKLTIPAGLNMGFNKHIELRDFGSGTFVLDASAVVLRDDSGNVITTPTSNITIQDVAITSIGGNEFKIIGLYQ